MPRFRILLAALGASAVFIAPSFAQESEELCMAPVEVTEALVRDAAMFDFRGFAGEAAAPAFVTGGLSPLRDSEEAATVFGAVVFLPDGQGGWRAFMPRPGESVVAAYAARETGAMMLVTQWQIEGPGQSWTLLRSSDGFATGECVRIEFPDALNQPSWTMETLELRDLDIAANGRGEIIGVSNTENHGALWFAYRTRDHGETWGPPRRLRRERQARAGLYTPIDVDAPPPEALLADLQRFAAGR